MADEILDEWTVKANDAMKIQLVTKADSGPPKIIGSFRPAWTYPLVGDEETIYGYKGLKINLQYNATDMRPHLSHTSQKRVPDAVATADSPEIQDIFEDYLPPVAFGRKQDFVDAVQNTPNDWHPPGELIETYDGDTDGSYEVWKGSLADPLVLGLIKRIQILVSLLIEGGTPIATESTEEREADPLDRWAVYFLYQKRPRPDEPGKFTYVFAGYSTVYRFYILRKIALTAASSSNLELPKGDMPFTEFPCRHRISQFIILEPFHHKGNGQRLYKTIYKTLLNDPMTFEITVEDPNEAFDALRDVADMTFLRQHPDFDDISINTTVKIPKKGPTPSNIVDKKAVEAVRTKFKIAHRQWARLVEMHLMSKLPDSVRTDFQAEIDSIMGNKGKGTKAATEEETHHYRLWKLFAKSRIATQNKEQLSGIEPGERIEALKKTLSSVELEYANLLDRFKELSSAETKPDGKKRKLDVEEGEGGAPASGKKPRTEEA